MAFYTNYVDDPFVDGEPILVGDRMNVFIRKLCDEIVLVSDGDWIEVTSGAPTPVDLRTYASTIATDVDNGDTATNGQHVTLYHATDPLIGSGDSRLLRFETYVVTQTYWFGVKMMDTAAVETWEYCWGSAAITLFIHDYGGYAGFGGTTGVFTPQRVFVFGDTEWLMFSVWDEVNGWTQGAGIFLFPASVDGFARGAKAYLWAYPWWRSTNDYIRSAEGSAYIGGVEVIVNHSGALDTAAEITLSDTGKAPLCGVTPFNRTGYFGKIMDLPRHYLIRTDLVSEMTEFTADSKSFLVVGLARSTVYSGCIDITPDPT